MKRRIAAVISLAVMFSGCSALTRIDEDPELVADALDELESDETDFMGGDSLLSDGGLSDIVTEVTDMIPAETAAVTSDLSTEPDGDMLTDDMIIDEDELTVTEAPAPDPTHEPAPKPSEEQPAPLSSDIPIYSAPAGFEMTDEYIQQAAWETLGIAGNNNSAVAFERDSADMDVVISTIFGSIGDCLNIDCEKIPDSQQDPLGYFNSDQGNYYRVYDKVYADSIIKNTFGIDMPAEYIYDAQTFGSDKARIYTYNGKYYVRHGPGGSVRTQKSRLVGEKDGRYCIYVEQYEFADTPDNTWYAVVSPYADSKGKVHFKYYSITYRNIFGEGEGDGGSSNTGSSPSKSDDGWKDMLVDALDEYASNQTSATYFFDDVNHDGIPEVKCYSGYAINSGMLYCSGSGAEMIWAPNSGDVCCYGDNIIIVSGGHMGYYSDIVYRLTPNGTEKLLEGWTIIDFQAGEDADTEVRTYTLDGAEVSEEEYNRKIDSYKTPFNGESSGPYDYDTVRRMIKEY